MQSSLKIFMAELIGTAVLLAFGAGSVAMTVLFVPDNMTPGGIAMGGYTNIVFGWGLAVAFGVIVSVRISGAHLNPAVTLALAASGRMTWNQVPNYVIAQMIGAFLGAGIVFMVFYAKWILVDPTLSHTAGIVSTFPAVEGFLPGFIDQVVGTFLLIYLILAVGNFIKNPTENMAFPFVIGAIVLIIGISFGGMNGYAINPARDLGPRIFVWLMGFQNTGFTGTVWLVPVIGPIVGGILGAKVFDWTIKE
ncbi:MAG: aquaporin family protein [Alphaproteobacteria bacterium]|jgi:glycerol uptake facilitator protein|nr:aquaporin family protein [Alphaproteobacteria bacterium]